MIDATDLRPFKFSELKIGGTFYLKNDDGSFSMCSISEVEIKDPMRAAILKFETEKFEKEGRLFVRINRPWKAFV